MDKDLTASQIDRQNILNNDAALAEIQQQTNIKGFLFEEKLCFTKSMVATYFEVDIRTIERYVSENQGELTENGYEILIGKRLKDFLDCIQTQDVPDIYVGHIVRVLTPFRTPSAAHHTSTLFISQSPITEVH